MEKDTTMNLTNNKEKGRLEMEQIQIDVMADSSEIVHYDTHDIPLYIRKGFLSNYPNKRAVCHWHDDFEIILILSGEMNYYINGQTLLLQKDDTLFINSREMHYGYANHNKDCEFICILFHPSLLSSNKVLFKDYISNFLVSTNISHLKLDPEKNISAIKYIYKIYEKKRVHDSFYEFDVIGLIYSFMACILRISNHYSQVESQTLSDDILMLRKMVSYIHENYKNNLILNDIASAANICKSKCCSLFQEQIHQTPFEFLNQYRLERSAELLKTTNMPVTSIAIECGFNHSSYYAKLFKRLYHCSPTEFRKNNSPSI